MFGKLTWQAIPFDQPIPLYSAAVVGLMLLAVLRVGGRQRLRAVSVARVDHERRSQAHRRHVLRARAADAAARLHRCPDDALATGGRFPCGRLSAAGALQPDLFRPRHHHDLLRRHAVHDRIDQLCHAAAARRARCRVPDFQLGRILADRGRCAAGQYFARRRRVLPRGLASLPAALRAAVFAGGRHRLLPLVAADLRRRHAHWRHQSRDDHSQDPRPGHELYAHADFLLDRARCEPAHRGGVSRSSPQRSPCCCSTVISIFTSSPTRPAAIP